MKILDAGCGSGVVIKSLFSVEQIKKYNAIEYCGFDLTPAMLDLFRAWIKGEKVAISLVQANVLNLDDLPDNWYDFDLIISSAMLEYVPKTHIVLALKNLKDRLAHHGTILIFISKKNLINKWLIKRWWKASLYEKGEIYQKLELAGFSGIQFHTFCAPYGYLNSWGFVISAKI